MAKWGSLWWLVCWGLSQIYHLSKQGIIYPYTQKPNTNIHQPHTLTHSMLTMQTAFLLFMWLKSIPYSTHIFPSHAKSISIPEIIKMNPLTIGRQSVLTIMQKCHRTFGGILDRSSPRPDISILIRCISVIFHVTCDVWFILMGRPYSTRFVHLFVCGSGRCIIGRGVVRASQLSLDSIGLVLWYRGLAGRQGGGGGGTMMERHSLLCWQTFEGVRKAKQRLTSPISTNYSTGL